VEVRNVAGRVLFAGDELGLPARLAIVGDLLVVLEAVPGPTFHVLQLVTGELLGSFGAAGEGPGEFWGPRSLQRDPGECCEFWIHDIGNARFTHVNVSSLLVDASTLGDSSITFIADETIIEARWLGDHVIATGFFGDGRVGVFNRNGSAERWIGAVPTSVRDLPARVRQHAYQSTPSIHPDRSKLAIATRHAGDVEIYDVLSGSGLSVEAPFSFEPVYEVEYGAGRPRMERGDDSRFGYVDLTSTETAIYGLFSGRTRGGYRSRASFGEFVHIFTWDGRFIEALQLEEAVVGIAVDANNSILYAIRHDPEPAVLAYPIQRR
jgi:hypothetical protein